MSLVLLVVWEGRKQLAELVEKALMFFSLVAWEDLELTLPRVVVMAEMLLLTEA